VAHAQVSDMMLEIGSMLGADRVRRPRGAEAIACETVVEPASAPEVAQIVRKCEADRITLAPIGAARTLARLRTIPVALGISLTRMSQVVAYEPEDLTVVAQAGITLAGLNARLGANRQRLPIDPPAAATLGAIVGAARAGPLRISEGLVRDLLIGIQFVGHGGRIARAGGRVVKNVAGYDLMKVLTGSFGTLGVVTEMALKIRPIPELYALGIAPHDRISDAFTNATKLHDTLALAHLEVLSPGPSAAFGHGGKFLLLAGFSGNRPEVDRQRAVALCILDGRAEILEADRAAELYQRLRDFEFATDSLNAELAVLPAELARCLADCAAEFRAHAGCGVAQISAPLAEAQAAQRILARWREVSGSASGHVRLVSAPPALRSGLQFFDEPNPGALSLMRRLKASFDPAGIFNPGCFVGGI
jgi:glycolate dehydrogenase FAD-binding subunit